MPTDESFLTGILENPDDESLRLVYADWLEEQGDLRGGYLRAEGTHARKNDSKIRQKLLTLLEQIDPVWAAMVSRPPFGILVPGLTFRDTGPKVTCADLKKLEGIWGEPLPPDYAAFLLTYNGDRPSKPYLWLYADHDDYYDEVWFFSTRTRHVRNRPYLNTSVLDLFEGHVADGGDEERFAKMMPIGAVTYGEGWEKLLVMVMETEEEGDRILEVEYSEDNGLCEADDVHAKDAFVTLLMELCEQPQEADGE